jgi:hypothetical protein
VKKLKIVRNRLRKPLIINGHILCFKPFASFFTAPDALRRKGSMDPLHGGNKTSNP